MHQAITHIVGAGLAGLSAATCLAEHGRRVAIYEASPQAGGRCRSYFDSTLNMVIDNGNHLLLSGNDAARGYLKRIGSETLFAGAGSPVFDFVDMETAKRWKLLLSMGKLPWWLLDKTRRIPDTQAVDYISILQLLWARPRQIITQLLNADSILYKRLWHPLLLSALNTHPREASAMLAGTIVKGSLLRGGKACVPMIAERLSDVFIDPALHYLAEHGCDVRMNQRLSAIEYDADKAMLLRFISSDSITVHSEDNVICAVPPWVMTSLLPNITAPDAYRAILNAHFRTPPPADFPRIMGVLNATIEWIFAFPDRISVTVSDADRLMYENRETLAERIWREVAAIMNTNIALPPWQIVKEKRATFAATPQQDAKRPGTQTAWCNVYLAGDWVQTGLPSTIEGAILSGVRAAEYVMKR